MGETGERRTAAEEEDVEFLRRQATEAATAYRRYIVTGDEAHYTRFNQIRESEFRGAHLYDTHEFTQPFREEMERVMEDEQVMPFLEAFREDRRALEPAIVTDPTDPVFIRTVHAVREGLRRSAPSEERVRQLTAQVRSSEGSPARADTPVGRVRSYMEGGMSLESAVRRELQTPNIAQLIAQHGENLTNLLVQRNPEEQARIAVDHLREFILTGDTSRRDAFRAIWDANRSARFTEELFSREFQTRIYDDSETGLQVITHAYNRIMQGTDPEEFANLVTQVYNIATTGTRQDVTQLVDRFVRQVHGDAATAEMARQLDTEVVAPLLEVVARGRAGHAIRLMRQVMATGDQQASNQFGQILNGRFLGAPIEENETFWEAFQSQYTAEISGNETLTAIVRGFRRNILPIAIRDIYTELARARPDMDRLNLDYGNRMVEFVSTHMQELSWFIRDGAQVEREITRRARFEDATAIRLRDMEMENRGQALAEVYSALLTERVATRGIEGREVVEENYDNLSWLAGLSAEQVQTELARRATPPRRGEPDALAVALQSRYGERAGEILSGAYARVTALRQRRAEITQRYGQTFVTFVSENLENLTWVVRPVEQIQSGMESRSSDAAVSQLRSIAGEDYSYSPVQLVSALARARQAITRGGLARINASESLGTFFVRPVVSREAIPAPTVSAEASEQRRRVLESRGRRLGRDIDGIERQLNYDILAPARALLAERIRRWRIVNERIRTDASTAYDEDTLARLEREQTELTEIMLEPQELRRAVEMAFSLIHVTETGGDITRVTAMPGTVEVDIDTRDLRTLLDWYRSLDEGKQDVIEEVVASVIRQASRVEAEDGTVIHPLYEFIGSLDQRGFFSALGRAYSVIDGRGADTRADITSRYGADFVRQVEEQAAHLRFLREPTASMADLSPGENLLFSSIVLRCYRAITNPQEGENRERMVRLFGPEFVAAVEQQREQLSSLAEAGAGHEQVVALPAEVKRALLGAYDGAYARTRTALMRAYLRQEAPLFYAIGAIHAVLRDPPAQDASDRERERFETRVNALNEAYGEELVNLVRENLAQFNFVRNVTAQPSELQRLDPQLQARLYTAFERGPGATRSRFMENFEHVATTLPGVYARLTNSMLFANPTEQLGTDFQEAVNIYRQEFGSNDYLFSLYINTTLLGQSLSRLAQHYGGVSIPSYMTDGNITPEDLARFFNSDEGRQLIRGGRTATDTLIRDTLGFRAEREFDPEEGEFVTNQEIANLTNRLSIVDALYMGIALERISGADSAFRQAAVHELTNTLVVISERDPYLVGPYLLQVLPAILDVAQDERTVVMAMTAFRQLFTTRYSRGQRSLAYSTALNRRYFLEVFERIGSQLPEITSTFDHTRMEDELRLVPEPRTDDNFMSPMLYRYRPGWWQYQEDQIPTLYGQYGEPLSMLPNPTAPRDPFLPVPGGFILDSGAMGLFSRMYDQLRPPAERLFRRGIPARYRIGALGASTILRRINELFGMMPVNYQDYWLAGAAEAGMFYAAEGQEGVREESEFVSREQSAGVGATGVLRGVSGGERAELRYTRDETTASIETPGEEAGETETVTSTSSRDQLRYRAEAGGVPSPLTGPVPLPLLDLVPVNWRDEGVGIQQHREQFEWERSRGMSGGEEVTTAEEYGGLLESYQRIASENQTDMLLFVAGNHVPELRGTPSWQLSQDDMSDLGVEDVSAADLNTLNEHLDDMNNASTAVARAEARQQAEQMLEGMGLTMDQVERQTSPELQEGSGRLRTRLYFVTEEGNIYQLAYGLDTETQLLNYLYGGANTQQALASLRFVGREMMTEDSAAAGFDGAAVGFTVPHGEGDTVSSLLFGQLVRNFSSMEPRHAEEAVGIAVTNLLDSNEQRDVYAAFYRGAETTEVDETDPTRITDSRLASGVGELMWRRMRIDPMAHAFEARVAGGYPGTGGVRWRHEIPVSRHEMYGYGALFSMSEIDLLREYRVVEEEAENLYGTMQTYLADVYLWDENTARNAGWLIAANYMYGNLENWVGEEEPGERPDNHYATLMMMYWANRHGLLIGGQRIPGFTNMYTRIDQAMREIQYNPDREEEILESLSEGLRSDMENDIWRFAIGYGYDGENIRLYTVGGGQYMDDEAYGNLYGLMLIGRPTRGFVDIMGHAYRLSSTVISQDEEGNPEIYQNPASPWIDLYLGAGVVDATSLDLMSYTRTVTLTPEMDVSGALMDVYMEMGSSSYNGQRLMHSYGAQMVNTVRESSADLSWLIRPESEVIQQLRTLVEEEEEPVARSLVAQLYAERMSSLSDADYQAAGRMIIDIYRELRSATPNRQRLVREYSADAVDIVATHASDLRWIMLERDALRTEFGRRAGQAGSLEQQVASVTISRAASESELTGEEVRLMFERNMTDVLMGVTDSSSRYGLSADRYDVILGTHLREDEERHDVFYVLHSPVAERAEARGSIVIGNEDDYNEWRREDRYIGRGVSRVEVEREEDDYNFVFSGDRRLRAFSAIRAIGGITLPLTEAEYDRYQAEHNWTVGGLVHLLQDHQNDWLLGALYGIRDYQEQQWEQFTITTALRHQLTNTATYTDQIFWYVFFNRTTGRVVLGSDSVWDNEQELQDVCEQLGGCAIGDLRRTTGGTGITWARADLVTGERLSLHFFFEGGVQETRDWEEAGEEEGGAEWSEEPIFRAGAAFSYLRQPESRVLGTEYTIGITGARGPWSIVPGAGEIGRPEYFDQWRSEMMAPDMGWWLMLYGRLRW